MYETVELIKNLRNHSKRGEEKKEGDGDETSTEWSPRTPRMPCSKSACTALTTASREREILVGQRDSETVKQLDFIRNLLFF